MKRVLAVLFRRSRFESEMDEELNSHLRHRTEELKRSGIPAEEAERQARVEFGGLEHYKEECRASAGTRFADVLSQDIRFALRMMSKSPAFTTITVLSLALGIGANTAMFSLTNTVLLRPLPYTHAERLVLLFESNPAQGVKETGCSYPDLEALRSANVFASVAGVNRHALILTGAGAPTELDTVVVTPEIFSLLDAKPLSGRALGSNDGRIGAAPAAVISEALWRGRFGSSPALVGRPIVLDQKAFTVIGIMPASFRVPLFGEKQDIWIPVAQDPLFGSWMSRRGGHWLRVVAQLKANTTLAQSQSEATVISTRLAREFPAENAGWTVQVAPLHNAIVADVRMPLIVLSAAVGLVLLLACVNIANLLLARATSRTRELAVRRALGAERGRIVRQLMTESALLGFLGSLLGLILAHASMRGVRLLFPPDLPAMRQVQIDPSVLVFAFIISLAATLLFGAAPAVLTTGSDLQRTLRDSGARSGSAGGALRIRRLLAAAEVGLAAVLLIGAGLLVRSLISITSIDPGFRVQHVMKAEVSLPRYRYSTPEQWRSFSRALLSRVHERAGLRNSAFAVPTPLGDGFINLSFSLPGRPALPKGIPYTADYVSITPEYFHVMGVPLLQGRSFDSRDSEGAPLTAIVSEAFARLYFRNENPIGKKMRFGFPPNGDVERTIVGVAGNVRDVGLTTEPGPMMYVPFDQAPFWGGDLVVSSTLPMTATASSIRSAVQSLDPDLPVSGVMTMQEVVAAFETQPKVRTALLCGFGVTSILLAALGVFGVLSYSVASRNREFGVRAALGATPRCIGKMVIVEGMSLGVAGLITGLAAAACLVRFLQTELYAVRAFDPLTFGASAAILLALAVIACYLPARRAMSVDPLVALGDE